MEIQFGFERFVFFNFFSQLGWEGDKDGRSLDGGDGVQPSVSLV